MSRRIWELDALRGLLLWGMAVVHLAMDAELLFGLPVSRAEPFEWVRRGGAICFILLSGLCAQLGRRTRRRGIQVLTVGMALTMLSLLAAALELLPRDLRIYFGILHLLGCCMLLYPGLQGWPLWAQAALGTLLLNIGYWLLEVPVRHSWLLVLGLTAPEFASADYFPLLPFAGWFVWGGVLSRWLYTNGVSRLPNVRPGPVLRALQWFGRHSLPFYLLHQPVCFALLLLGMALTR